MTNKPHDALFKAVFEQPEHAGALLRDILPAALGARLRWSTLVREPGSFIDPQLADSHSDLLFSIQLGPTRALLYLLLEHQSRSDHGMPLRMLRYFVRICERHRKRHLGPLALIVPAVITHAPAGWTAPTSFHAMFNPHPATIPGLARLIPEFSLVVEDLAHLGNEELKSRALAAFPKLALWLLRDGRDPEALLRNVEHWSAAFREALAAPRGMQAVGVLLRYIALVSEDVHFEQFRARLCQQIPEAEETIMTYGERLLHEGRTRGRAEALERQLTIKFREVPPEYLERLRTATEEQLDRDLERILSATTLAGVFG